MQRMKALLNAIKAQLPAQVSVLNGIEILPHQDILPDGVRLQFCGIKDGTVTYDGGLDECTVYEVHFFVYVEISRPEASVVGFGTRPGVLDLASLVEQGLETLGNLGLDWLNDGERAPVSRPSEPGTLNDGDFIQRKELVWRYRVYE